MSKARSKAPGDKAADEVKAAIKQHEEQAPHSEDAPEASPARSEVNPGGGTFVGAILHLRVPTGKAGNASDVPTAAEIPPAMLEAVSQLAEGADITFPEHYSLPLADGGYTNAGRIRVVHQPEPGRTVVEVLA